MQVSERDAFVEKLQNVGIPTAVHYPVPLHRQPAYQDICRISGSLKHSESVADRVVSLPMSPYISDTVIDVITKVISGKA